MRKSLISTVKVVGSVSYYVQQIMKKDLALISFLFSVSAPSNAETNVNVYQVTLRAEQGDMQLFVCINDECQKSLSNTKSQDESRRVLWRPQLLRE